MDPNAALERILQLADWQIKGHAEYSDNTDLAETILALHEWIVKGGILPQMWYKKE